MTTESQTSALDVNGAAAEFSRMLEPQEAQADEVTNAEAETNPEKAQTESETEAKIQPEGEASAQEEAKPVTVMIDGKPVELTPEQIAEAYKSGLRQADYTKKTMEVAEQRKAADAEIHQAQQERAVYAQRLQEQSVLLSAALQEQNQINWQQLLETDPVEYLKQQHLYQQRQGALMQAQQEQSRLMQVQQAEQQTHLHKFVEQQQEELLAKLPEWKDDAKAKAEKAALKEWLSSNGISADEINQLADHRQVLIARKAMLYDQMISKAQAAAKKVSNLPQKVEKPGVSESRSLDKRSSAYQRLSKSGSIDDAAAVFATIL